MLVNLLVSSTSALGPVLAGLVPLVVVVVILTVVAVTGAAVWSSRPARRCAAAAVLDRILTALERLLAPGRPTN